MACVLQRSSESDIHSEVIRVALVGSNVLGSITCPAGGDATPITEACRKDSSSAGLRLAALMNKVNPVPYIRPS
jgi:hypothetical protein